MKHHVKMSKEVILAHSKRTTSPLHCSLGINTLIITIKVLKLFTLSPEETVRTHGEILGYRKSYFKTQVEKRQNRFWWKTNRMRYSIYVT